MARYLVFVVTPVGVLVGMAIATYDWVVNEVLWKHIAEHSLVVRIFAPALGMFLTGCILRGVPRPLLVDGGRARDRLPRPERPHAAGDRRAEACCVMHLPRPALGRHHGRRIALQARPCARGCRPGARRRAAWPERRHRVASVSGVARQAAKRVDEVEPTHPGPHNRRTARLARGVPQLPRGRRARHTARRTSARERSDCGQVRPPCVRCDLHPQGRRSRAG